MAQVKAIILVLLGLVIVVAVVQNNQAMSTPLTFRLNPFFTSEWKSSGVSVYQVTFIAFFLGVVVVGFFGLVERFRLKRRIKVLSKELESKDQELNSLRNLPITSDHPRPAEKEAA
jgi:putative membrane protein